MLSNGSVTEWLNQLQAGDEAAAQKLWERYLDRLVTLARKRLRGTPRQVADEEDVALSVFDSFCRAAELGRFPQLHDRHGLWRLLVTITARKVSHHLRDAARQKRGGKQPATSPSSPAEMDLDELLGPEPSPDFAAQAAEEFHRLLDRLNDDELRSIAVWKMEGYTTEEIARKLGCVPSTVERRLRLIRSLWEKEVGP